MHWSPSRLVGTMIVGVFIAVACTSATIQTPDGSPTASLSVAVDPAAASPTPAATPASPTPSPMATPQPTPVPAPPKPTGVKFDEYAQMRDSEDGLVGAITQTVTWRAPQSEDVEIRVYGVTECIAEPASPAPGTSGPCLVVHTPLPASVRTLLATAPASDGVVSWTWTQHRADCGYAFPASDPARPAYHAVVLAAYSASDHSIFAIAEPGRWWRAAPGDIVC